MHDFRQLRVWQLSRELLVTATLACRAFPRTDRGLVGMQLRRSALSIPANIAEGCGKSSRRETIRFLQIASGSARELENHVQLALDLGYMRRGTGEQLLANAKSIQKMLFRLIANLPPSSEAQV